MQRLFLRAGVASCVLVATVAWASPAAAAVKVPADGTYRGKGTEIVTSPDGSAVTIKRVPVRIKCKGTTPSNLGEDLGPFPIKRDGSFTNGVNRTEGGSGNIALSGKFSSDGTKVAGRVAEADFVDKEKDFDCPSYKGTFSAKLVKGTGLRPGQVLARDRFSDSKSGFETFNSANSFGEYLKDGRYRLGLRAPGAAFALRAKPVVPLVDVKATVRWYGNDEQDGAGLVCQGDGGSFSVGFVRGNGQVELKRYVNGNVFESAPPATAPAGLLKAGKGEANKLELICAPESSEQATELTFSVNGTVVHRAKTSASAAGKTGFFVDDQAGGTDFNFQDYVASVPKR
jgi:hypothetical protein